jgi:hypothetical protein
MNRLHALVAKQESSLETLLKEAETRSEEMEELRANMSKLQVKSVLIYFVKITGRYVFRVIKMQLKH